MATSRVSDSNTTEAPGQGSLLDDPELLKEVVQRWLQELLESELSEYLGAGRYERTGSRRGHRSGHRPRRLQTRLGERARVEFDATGLAAVTYLLQLHTAAGAYAQRATAVR
ncbi:MAG: transposase [bacterium]